MNNKHSRGIAKYKVALAAKVRKREPSKKTCPGLVAANGTSSSVARRRSTPGRPHFHSRLIIHLLPLAVGTPISRTISTRANTLSRVQFSRLESARGDTARRRGRSTRLAPSNGLGFCFTVGVRACTRTGATGLVPGFLLPVGGV